MLSNFYIQMYSIKFLLNINESFTVLWIQIFLPDAYDYIVSRKYVDEEF